MSDEVLDWRAWHKIAFDLMKNWPPGRILDIPSFKGALPGRLREIGFTPVCGDLDPTIFEESLPFVKLNLNRALPFRSGSLDYVTFLEGIEHLERPFDTLREISRVLRAGGRLIISTPNVWNLRSRWRYLVTGHHLHFRDQISTDELQHSSGGHIFPLSYRELHYLLTRQNLRVEQILTDKIRRKFLPLHFLLRGINWFYSLKTPYGDVLRRKEVTDGQTLILVAYKDAQPE